MKLDFLTVIKKITFAVKKFALYLKPDLSLDCLYLTVILIFTVKEVNMILCMRFNLIKNIVITSKTTEIPLDLLKNVTSAPVLLFILKLLVLIQAKRSFFSH